MNFWGVIDQIAYTEGDLAIRLVQGSPLLDERLHKPVRIIEGKGVREPVGDFKLLEGEEIDGYEFTDEKIVFWVCWTKPDAPLEFTGSQFLVRDEDYSEEDYLKAIRRSNEAFQRQARELTEHRNKLKKIESFIDREIHRLSERSDFHSDKSAIYTKAIDVLQRLRRCTTGT